MAHSHSLCGPFSPDPAVQQFNMGCICSTRDKGATESMINLSSFTLFEDRVSARSFDQWDRIVPYLSSADWLSLHLVSKKMKRFTQLKTKTPTRLTFASLNSLSFSVELSTAQEYRQVLTPIPAESGNSSHTSPFLTGQSLQSLLSNLASRSATPLGFLPVTEDIEERVKHWKIRVWEDARVGRSDAFGHYMQTGVKPLASLLDLTFKLEHIVVSLSLLATAVSSGSVSLVRCLLDSTRYSGIEDLDPDRGLSLERTQVDSDEKIDSGGLKKFETRVSPLQLAAAKGMAEIVELLVVAGANVSISGTQKTDLTYLIKYLELGLPPVLLAAKGLVDDPIELELPIQVAPVPFIRDFPRTLEVLIGARAQLNVSAEEPFLFYCLKHPALLRQAIQVYNNCGRRPLDEACMRSLYESVEVLLESGAMPYSPPRNAFEYCTQDPALLKVIVGHYPVAGDQDRPSLVYAFVQLAHLPLVTEISNWDNVTIDAGETHQGFNLMHRIAQTKNREFLHLLLPKMQGRGNLQALINTAVEGGTCLWLALPDYNLVEDLRKLGGDLLRLRFVDCYRIYQSHKMLIHYLLSEGLDINDSDEYGKTAFSYACQDFHVAMQLELIKMGCDVNCRDREGMAPLHEACLKGYFVQAKLLLRHGANPQLSTNRGETALDMVQKPYRGKTASVAKKLVLLLKSYADGTFIE